MNKLYETMKRIGTKNLKESLWDIGKLSRNKQAIIDLSKPVVTPSPNNPRPRWWQKQKDGTLKWFKDYKATDPWTEKDDQIEFAAKIQLAKKLIDDLGGQEEAEETLIGAFNSADSLIPIIKPFIGKKAKLKKSNLIQMTKILSPKKSTFFANKILSIAKSVGVNITA